MQNHDIRVLNDLIETTIDSADGYAEAAKDAGSGRYAATFQSRSTERQQVFARLQQQVQALGGEAEEDGTALASAHRMFVNLRQTLSSGDKAIVDEVERGEDHIKAKYESAMKDREISAATQAVISEAYRSVRTGHDQMRDLKHSLEDNT